MKLSKLSKLLVSTFVAASLCSASAFAQDIGDSQAAAPVIASAKMGITDKIYTSKKPSIRVATYNIGAAMLSSVEDVVKAVKSLKADVICLNEVDRNTVRSGNLDQAAFIAKELNMEYAFAKTMDFDGGEYGMAILSKHPIKNFEVVNLPNGQEGVDEPRIVLICEIDHPRFESPVVMMNTHLDYKEDHVLQRRQITRLNDLAVANITLKNIESFTTKVKILAGDFNDTYNSENIAELQRYWDPVVDKEAYKMRTWPALNPMADLDHIFTSRGQRWHIRTVHVPTSKENKINWASISDHRPVVADLQLIER